MRVPHFFTCFLAIFLFTLKCNTRRHIRRSTVRCRRSRYYTAGSPCRVLHSSLSQMSRDSHTRSGAADTRTLHSGVFGEASSTGRYPVQALRLLLHAPAPSHYFLLRNWPMRCRNTRAHLCLLSRPAH